MIDALLLDLSGVLYEGAKSIPGAANAVERAQRSGVQVRFITNTSQKPREDLLRHLYGLGFSLDSTQLFTAVDAARDWLQTRKLRPFCLVHENIVGEFSDMDQRDPNAVFLADAATGFNFENMNRAFQLCMAGAPFLGIGYNRYCKSGDELQLDAGPFVKAIEFAAGAEATIVGKPSEVFFREVMASTQVSPERTIMVGDDVFSDVEGALRVGMNACLVKTGKYLPGDEHRITGDFLSFDSVVEVVDFILKHRD